MFVGNAILIVILLFLLGNINKQKVLLELAMLEIVQLIALIVQLLIDI